MDKKGMQRRIMIIILAIIMGMVALMFFAGVNTGIKEGSYNTMCKFSVWTSSYSSLPANIHLIPTFCTVKPRDLYPDNWNNCNEDFEIAKDVNGCLAEQVADLMRKCWTTRGSGAGEVGDMTCYVVTVFEPDDEFKDESIRVDHKLLEKVMNEYKPKGKTDYYSDILGNDEFQFEDEWFEDDDRISTGERWHINYVEDWDVAHLDIILDEFDGIVLELVSTPEMK